VKYPGFFCLFDERKSLPQPNSLILCYDRAMSFREEVYTLIRKIPAGKVATYGQVAALVGNPKAARAIGMCMRTNPDAPRTPCHRIVSSDGSMTGYSAGNGVSSKKELLLKEGVVFKGEKVDLTISQWHPNV
jgi:methylated-DNA-protein-cysteine methyltransferase-like protein